MCTASMPSTSLKYHRLRSGFGEKSSMLPIVAISRMGSTEFAMQLAQPFKRIGLKAGKQGIHTRIIQPVADPKMTGRPTSFPRGVMVLPN